MPSRPRNGRADELQRELQALFESQNTARDGTAITAAFLCVTVTAPG